MNTDIANIEFMARLQNRVGLKQILQQGFDIVEQQTENGSSLLRKWDDAQ